MQPGSKVTVHFSVTLEKASSPIFDTRRLHLAPFELRLGKGFMFSPLEETVKTMQVGEQRVVHLSAQHTPTFASLASVLRDESEKKEGACVNKEHGEHKGICPGLPVAEHAHGDCEHAKDAHEACGHAHHTREPSREKHDHDHSEGRSCCGAAARKHADLLAIMDSPIVLTVKVLDIELPGEFAREHWELSLQEKLAAVPGLREQGNTHFRSGQYAQATASYETALGYIEALVQSTVAAPEMVAEAKTLRPILLSNFCASQLKRGAFLEVIKYTTELLDADPDNSKNLLRRAQAHTAVGNHEKAQIDLDRAAKLTSDPLVAQLQDTLQQAVAKARAREKAMFGGMFTGKH
eukprot:m.81601 g.81601  ORF g.81601 m.81601 type:complete len:350 (-) comp13370_c5_seq4:290-1339(-)